MVACSIMEAFPELGDGDAVSTSMGANGEDIRMSPAARRCVPLSIECKNVEKINIWSCLEQASSNAPEGVPPCLVFTRNRSPTWAVVPWTFLVEALRACRGGDASSAGCVVETNDRDTRVRELLRQLTDLMQAGEDVVMPDGAQEERTD